MSKKKGFTLIELLVVIAIIALLLSILLPSLRKVKEIASGVVCLFNQKNLGLAWVMYAVENKDMIVGGSTYNGTEGRWVEPPLRNAVYGSARAGINEYSLETRINGIRAGKLFSYTKDEGVYHCPGDKSDRGQEPFAAYRSYAISGLMNGEDSAERSVMINGVSKKLILAVKSTQVVSPDLKYVFIEENIKTHNQEFNAGSFVLFGGGAFDWWDWPADYHSKSSTMGFADGHSEQHKWGDPDTIEKIKGGTDPDPLNNEDLKWLVQGYIPISR